MKARTNYLYFLLSSGFIAVFVLFTFASAQEIDKEKALEVMQLVGGPGGCSSENSCRSFCDNPDNFDICINWARENGLISSAEADKVNKLAKVGKEFSGPGGCQSPEECESFCEQPQNHGVCLDFAVAQGFLTLAEAQKIKEFRTQAGEIAGRFEQENEIEIDPGFDRDKAQQILDTQGGPGGCTTMEACEAFCEQPQNQEICFEFAESHGLFENHEAAQKIKHIIQQGGPGGCRGEEQCREFCENPDNFEVCIKFGEEYGIITPQELEKAKQGAEALKHGGPGGCHGPKECEEFCSNPANQGECFNWAKEQGFVSEEQIIMMEEFERKREEIEQGGYEFENRGDDFYPEYEEFEKEKGFESDITPHMCPMMPTVDSCPVGYQKILSFSSPECGSYYQCIPEQDYPYPSYTPSETPPPKVLPEPVYTEIPYPEPSPIDPALECVNQGGVWDSQMHNCIFEKDESILHQTGAYILEIFRQFFK